MRKNTTISVEKRCEVSRQNGERARERQLLPPNSISIQPNCEIVRRMCTVKATKKVNYNRNRMAAVRLNEQLYLSKCNCLSFTLIPYKGIFIHYKGGDKD